MYRKGHRGFTAVHLYINVEKHVQALLKFPAPDSGPDSVPNASAWCSSGPAASSALIVCDLFGQGIKYLKDNFGQ